MGATGLSAGSLALQGYATMLQAQGVASADEFQASKLKTAATYGELKAVQVGGQMTRSLNQTLGNIDAVHAAAGTDPNSPTGAAFRDDQENIGTQQRTTTVDSILAQATQDKSDAAYYKSAASSALFAGEIGAAAGIAKGIAGVSFGSTTAPGGKSIGDPTVLGGLY
jgi:hypothetical protein